MTGVIAYPKVLKNSCNGQFLTDHYKSIDLCFTLLASGELVLKRLFAISHCFKKLEKCLVSQLWERSEQSLLHLNFPAKNQFSIDVNENFLVIFKQCGQCTKINHWQTSHQRWKNWSDSTMLWNSTYYVMIFFTVPWFFRLSWICDDRYQYPRKWLYLRYLSVGMQIV